MAMALLCVCAPADAAAQHGRRPALQVSSGYAGFVDDATVPHSTVGGGWRWQLTRRVSAGPAVVYMRGPGGDRDLFLTMELAAGFRPGRLIEPYLVADGGVMFHRDLVSTGPYWSKEPAGSFGGGVRLNLNDRVYVGPEVRIGWEPHVRVTGTLGWRLGAW